LKLLGYPSLLLKTPALLYCSVTGCLTKCAPYILSICPSVWGWNTVNNLLSIPNILFNSCIIPATNWGLWSEMILSGNPCNFYTLSLNNYANPSAEVFSVVEIKCTIFVNLSTTTQIESYPWAKGNLVIKSAKICVQGFSGIELDINFPAGCSVQFLFCW